MSELFAVADGAHEEAEPETGGQSTLFDLGTIPTSEKFTIKTGPPVKAPAGFSYGKRVWGTFTGAILDPALRTRRDGARELVWLVDCDEIVVERIE